MKKMLVLATAVALASCGKKEETTVVETPVQNDTAMAPVTVPAGTTATAQSPTGSMAGQYEIKLADGRVVTQSVNADGTYSETANGKAMNGKWRMNGADACFDPDGAATETCFTTSAPGADGSFTMTGPDGKTYGTVRKVGAATAM